MNQTIIKPNLIIAGVTKAGTTSLYSYLRNHPEICGASVKETCYFLPLRYSGEQIAPSETYFSYFSQCSNEKHILEATPGYYYGGYETAVAIKNLLGNANIILMFRNPIDRFFSFYKYQKSQLNLPASLSAEEYLESCLSKFDPKDRTQEKYWGIIGGYYDNYLEDWYKVFSDKLHIFFFDELQANPQKLLVKICEALDIQASYFQNYNFTIENKSVNYRNAKIHALTLKINRVGEKFWRANPKLKQTLRSSYYKINGTQHDISQSDSIRTLLETHFAGHNKNLAAILAAHGKSYLPDWLKS